MRTTTPIAAVQVDDVLASDCPAGGFKIDPPIGAGVGGVRRLWMRCPCGCGRVDGLPIRPVDKVAIRASWDLSGPPDKPTLRPSVNLLDGRAGTVGAREHWHGWLTDGVWSHV